MKTITVQIDPATLNHRQRGALSNLNRIYIEDAHVCAIQNVDVKLDNGLVIYDVEVDDESPTFEGDAFFREDFLCGIMDVLDEYK